MIEKDRIYNMDCLEGMELIPEGSIDAVICDLPYGTMKGIDDKHDWDEVIPTEKLFAAYARILRRGGWLYYSAKSLIQVILEHTMEGIFIFYIQ